MTLYFMIGFINSKDIALTRQYVVDVKTTDVIFI